MESLAHLLHFHLKYCERCGSLWLRPDGADTLYCSRCTRLMAALPLRRPRRPKPARNACPPVVTKLIFSLLPLFLHALLGVAA